MKLQTIVFDLWFTLISPEDHRPRGARTADAIPLAFGADPRHFDVFWRACERDRYGTSRSISEYIEDYARTVGRELGDAERAAIDAVWSHHDAALAQPRVDVLGALADLKQRGFRLGLLSNAHEREVRLWRESPLAVHFSAACFSCQIGCLKPERQAYEEVLDRMSAAPESAVFVGDGASSELQGAGNAGFAKTVFMRGFLADTAVDENVMARSAEQADVVIDKLGELPDLLA